MKRLRLKNFDIGQICDSGQCFRMEPIGEGRYSMVAGNRYLEIEQNKEGVLFRCEKTEFERFWKPYFDLETDYQLIQEQIEETDNYLKEAASFGQGIRILRQDPWEMLITFIVSQQNHIKRIRKILRLLCEKYGEQIDCPQDSWGERKIYHTFPMPSKLAKADLEDLKACNLGYRARYVKETARQVADGEVNIEGLTRLSYPEAKKELLHCCGVGEKVADCICLFGLHQLEAFPIDTHIRQILALHYPEGFPFDRYRGVEGVIQQYLFYFDLHGTDEEEQAEQEIS